MTVDAAKARLAEKSRLFQEAVIGVGSCSVKEAMAFQGASSAFAALGAALNKEAFIEDVVSAFRAARDLGGEISDAADDAFERVTKRLLAALGVGE